MRTGFAFTIAADHPSLAGHFPGRPIVPGVLLLDHVLAGIADKLGRQVDVLQRVKFASALLPDEAATVTVDLEGMQLKFSVQVARAGADVTLATGTLRLSNSS